MFPCTSPSSESLHRVLFGYGSDELKKISIVEAGESDLKDAMQLFEPKNVLYLFAQACSVAYQCAL